MRGTKRLLITKYEVGRLLLRLLYKQWDNIKIGVREVVCEGMTWFHMIQRMAWWLDILDMVKKF